MTNSIVMDRLISLTTILLPNARSLEDPPPPLLHSPTPKPLLYRYLHLVTWLVVQKQTDLSLKKDHIVSHLPGTLHLPRPLVRSPI